MWLELGRERGGSEFGRLQLRHLHSGILGLHAEGGVGDDVGGEFADGGGDVRGEIGGLVKGEWGEPGWFHLSRRRSRNLTSRSRHVHRKNISRLTCHHLGGHGRSLARSHSPQPLKGL